MVSKMTQSLLIAYSQHDCFCQVRVNCLNEGIFRIHITLLNKVLCSLMIWSLIIKAIKLIIFEVLEFLLNCGFCLYYVFVIEHFLDFRQYTIKMKLRYLLVNSRMTLLLAFFKCLCRKNFFCHTLLKKGNWKNTFIGSVWAYHDT